MFKFAIFLGIYTYILFFLGIVGVLYESVVVWFSLLSFLLFIVYEKNAIKFTLQVRQNFKRENKIAQRRILLALLAIFATQALINYLGALAPELAFDALWYHLTLPKLYLLNHAVYHIPGGLLYYSDMPKLGEMLYVSALAFGNEITAKIVHFLFGILSASVIYLLSRKFFSHVVSLIALVIFYSNLVVAWESTTAYVDLIRTFFEILALWGFINWRETKKQKWFFLSAIMVGLAITTKFLAFGSLIIFLLFILFPLNKKNLVQKIITAFHYFITVIAIPIPWLIFAYINTGNPFYPFFSNIYKITPEPLSVMGFFTDIWNVFVNATDPISPVYIIFLPLVISVFSRMSKEMKFITLYSAIAIVIWYFTPRTGGGRFILPYLPAFSIVCAAVIDIFMKQKKKVLLAKYLLALVIITSMLTIGYRFMAEIKYIPVLIGEQTKHDFLKENLNYGYGDFYDIDNKIKLHTDPSEKVLLYGFHNLYYIDFPFIDSTWVKPGDTFSYIAVQNGEIPERFKNWQLIYSNDKTAVKLYENKYSKTTIY